MIQDQPQHDEAYQVTGWIARQLGEHDQMPMRQIRRIVTLLGPERALVFVEQAKQIEANGGMWLEKQNRRRTLGGVFFRLVRDGVAEQERLRIWPTNTPRGRRQRQAPPKDHASSSPLPAPSERFSWDDLPAIIAQIGSSIGKATTVKVTIIGRPAQVVQKQGFYIIGMKYDKQPSLPKGLPDFPAQPTKYMVFIAAKQWAKVADALDNPEDLLIIEGTPAHDPRFPGVLLYATNVTTKLQQQAKRQQQIA